MNTTYDEVYKLFISITKTDGINLPDTDEKIYDLIHAAVRKNNNRMRDNLGWDDTLEQFDRELSDDDFILLANCIKLCFLENDRVEYITIFSGFTKEVGIKNYNATLKGKEKAIEDQKIEIKDIVFNSDDEEIM